MLIFGLGSHPAYAAAMVYAGMKIPRFVRAHVSMCPSWLTCWPALVVWGPPSDPSSPIRTLSCAWISSEN